MKKPKVTATKYIVDVCLGCCVALFPDGTLRQFRDKDETLKEIKRNEQIRAKKTAIALNIAVIKWNYKNHRFESPLR